MNAGRNYNGPKVAKFLGIWVVSRTNGITRGKLSQLLTRWIYIEGEDAFYPYQDEKTLWSFTVGCCCFVIFIVQDSWEAKKSKR